MKLLHEIGWRLANTTHWPEWYDGNPFKAVREQSSAARGAGTNEKNE